MPSKVWHWNDDDIRHKTHISCWFLHTRDSLVIGKSFLDTWSYRQTRGKRPREIVCLCPHNHQGRGSWPEKRDTKKLRGPLKRIEQQARGYDATASTSGGNPPYSNSRKRSVYCPCMSPQTFIGAPNSKSIGWLNKTSLVWLHRFIASWTLISTGVPGFLFLAERRLSIMPSIHDSSEGPLLFWRIILTRIDFELDRDELASFCNRKNEECANRKISWWLTKE